MIYHHRRGRGKQSQGYKRQNPSRGSHCGDRSFRIMKVFPHYGHTRTAPHQRAQYRKYCFCRESSKNRLSQTVGQGNTHRSIPHRSHSPLQYRHVYRDVQSCSRSIRRITRSTETGVWNRAIQLQYQGRALRDL